MNSSVAPQPKLQINTGQLRAGAILIGVGGTFVLAGAVVAGSALW